MAKTVAVEGGAGREEGMSEGAGFFGLVAQSYSLHGHWGTHKQHGSGRAMEGLSGLMARALYVLME